MIEKIITSKTRVKLLKLFLTHIDDRYYLRELERKLDESLSPLRRQLLKLVKMGILVTEEEANLKYYRLDRNFAGIEELRKLVLGKTEEIVAVPNEAKKETSPLTPALSPQGREGKRFKYDAMVLTAIAFFVLATAVYVVYMNSRNITTVANLVTEKTTKIAEPTRPDEMTSKRWKVLPGNIPVLSSGETGGKKSQEL